MLIILSNKIVFLTEQLTGIKLEHFDKGECGLEFNFGKEKGSYTKIFKTDAIAQRNLDNIVRAYHEGHREVYLEE